MKCDTAFEYMTDADLRNSDELEQHLDRCPRCRQMQDTLAPALELFGDNCFAEYQEANGLSFSANEVDYESADVDGKRTAPFLTQDAVRLAEEVAERLRPQREIGVTAGSRSFRLVMRGVAAAVIALLASAVIFSLDTEPRQTAGSFRVDSANCWWHHADSKLMHQASAETTILGCLECHNSSVQPAEKTNEEPKIRTSHSKVLACVSCHQGTISEQLNTLSLDQVDADPLVSCLWPSPNG